MPIYCSLCDFNVNYSTVDASTPTGGVLGCCDFPCATLCGHVFHNGCLRNRLDLDNACPQCRKRCDPRDIVKLFLPTEGLTMAPIRLRNAESHPLVDDINAQIQQMETKCATEKFDLEEQLRVSRSELNVLFDRNSRLMEQERGALQTDKCKNESCSRTVSSRLFCPHHAACTQRCRVLIGGLSVLRSMDNGELICTNCATIVCHGCKRRLTGTCAKLDGFVYHERCFPCVRCESPLGRPAAMLHTTLLNRFHENCIVCYKCSCFVTGFVQFRGLKPMCNKCK